MQNTFKQAARTLPETDIRTLATIVRCAHTDSDVWAGCRVARALVGADLAPILNGRIFSDFVSDNGDIAIEALREQAWEYLS